MELLLKTKKAADELKRLLSSIRDDMDTDSLCKIFGDKADKVRPLFEEEWFDDGLGASERFGTDFEMTVTKTEGVWQITFDCEIADSHQSNLTDWLEALCKVLGFKLATIDKPERIASPVQRQLIANFFQPDAMQARAAMLRRSVLKNGGTLTEAQGMEILQALIADLDRPSITHKEVAELKKTAAQIRKAAANNLIKPSDKAAYFSFAERAEALAEPAAENLRDSTRYPIYRWALAKTSNAPFSVDELRAIVARFKADLGYDIVDFGEYIDTDETYGMKSIRSEKQLTTALRDLPAKQSGTDFDDCLTLNLAANSVSQLAMFYGLLQLLQTTQPGYRTAFNMNKYLQLGKQELVIFFSSYNHENLGAFVQKIDALPAMEAIKILVAESIGSPTKTTLKIVGDRESWHEVFYYT